MVAHRTGELVHLSTGRFQFVEGRLDVGQEQAVPVIGSTLEYVDQRFQDTDTVVILDSPPGTACPVVAATRNADFVILVTEPTPFGLHDLTLAVDLMRDLRKDFVVVVNRYGIGNDDVLEYCQNSSIPVPAVIPNSREVAELYSRGELIYDKIPEVRAGLKKVLAAIHDRSRRVVL
jgi:MinD superfamily P-loop ATPase